MTTILFAAAAVLLLVLVVLGVFVSYRVSTLEKVIEEKGWNLAFEVNQAARRANEQSELAERRWLNLCDRLHELDLRLGIRPDEASRRVAEELCAEMHRILVPDEAQKKESVEEPRLIILPGEDREKK